MIKKNLKEIIKELSEIHEKLAGRLREYKRFEKYKREATKSDLEPVFENENGITMKCSEALAPCNLVNTNLSKFVELSSGVFAKEQEDSLFEIIKINPSLKKKVEELRQIAIYAEEAMEKEAMRLIFKSIENNPKSFKERIQKFSERNLRENKALKRETARLKAMVVDFPKWTQTRNPEKYKGLVFKYFDNYVSLVHSEIKLLKNYKPSDENELKKVVSSPELSLSEAKHLTLNRSYSADSMKSMTPKHTTMDEISSNQTEYESLGAKTFTFVGAGFPLTGVILHQETGAKVKLVDCDLEAVENAKRFLKYCEEVGIVNKDSISVLHANALDLDFRPVSGYMLEGKDENNKINTDFLDLASAIPSEVTNEILKNNVHKDVLVRKRNVRGLSKLLYERYDLTDSVPYKLAAEVTTPQDYLNRRESKKIVGLTKSNNINSCELFQRTV